MLKYNKQYQYYLVLRSSRLNELTDQEESKILQMRQIPKISAVQAAMEINVT